MAASRTRGAPNFARALRERPHEIGSPTRRLWRSLSRSLTPPFHPAWKLRLSQTQGDQAMRIEQHIEELRAELRNSCDAAERREIATELKLAERELAAVETYQSGCGFVRAEPPS